MATQPSSWFVGENESLVNTDKGKRKRLKKSFLKALESKYSQHADVEPLKYVQIVFHGKPKADSESELGYLRNVVLTDSNIAVSGLTSRSLKDVCPHVVDLDISGNLFDNWKSVLTIVSQLDNLKYLNLSRNPLSLGQKSLEEWQETLPEVENLVLNSTDIPWTDVIKLTELFQQLKELHICGNGYSEIPDDDHKGMKAIETLRLNDNKFESWDQIWKLKHLARLKSLILSGNPLQDVYFHDNNLDIQCGCENTSKHSSKFYPENFEHKPQYHNAEEILMQEETSEIYDECRNLLEALVWNIYIEQTNQGKPEESFDFILEPCQGQSEQYQGQAEQCQGQRDKFAHDTICDKSCDSKNAGDFITGKDVLNQGCDAPIISEQQDCECNKKSSSIVTSRPKDIEEALGLPQNKQGNTSDQNDGYDSCKDTNNVRARLAGDGEALDLHVQKQANISDQQADDRKEEPVYCEKEREDNCDVCTVDKHNTSGQEDVECNRNTGNNACDLEEEQVPDNSHNQGIDLTKHTESKISGGIETCKSSKEMKQGIGDENGTACPACDGARLKPFHNLENICLSDTKIGKWKHLAALSAFPSLSSVRIKDVKLGSRLNQEDRRKLFVPCLPNIKMLNGSEVTATERDKGERYLLRYFCDKPQKPSIYSTLEKKHGTLTPLVDIDICRGYQEWVALTFVFEGEIVFTETVSVRQPVGKLRMLIADKLCLYASLKNIKMYHKYCNPQHQSDLLHTGELEQLVLDTLPISRFDVLDGDEIHVDLYDRFTYAAMQFIYIRNYLPKKMDLLDVLKSK